MGSPPTVRICKVNPKHAGTCTYFIDPVYEDVPALEIKGQWALLADDAPSNDGSPRRQGQGCAYPGFSVTHVESGMALAQYLTEAVARDLLDKAYQACPQGSVLGRKKKADWDRPLLPALRSLRDEALEASRLEVRASGVAWMRYPGDILP